MKRFIKLMMFLAVTVGFGAQVGAMVSEPTSPLSLVKPSSPNKIKCQVITNQDIYEAVIDFQEYTTGPIFKSFGDIKAFCDRNKRFSQVLISLYDSKKIKTGKCINVLYKELKKSCCNGHEDLNYFKDECYVALRYVWLRQYENEVYAVMAALAAAGCAYVYNFYV